jgi:hypothetical protein
VIFFLDQVRRTIASRPLWLFLAILLVSISVRRTFQRNDDAPSSPPSFARYAAAIGLLYYVAIVIWYASVPQQLDYAEPTMTGVAWLFAKGKAVYHAIDSPDRYSHMYGPMAFVVPGIVLQLFGPSMFVAKAIGVVAALVALALMWWTIRNAAADNDGWSAILACGLCVLQFLMFRNLTFWSRPEPLQLVAVCAGLFAAARLNGVTAAVVIALAMGLLWNLKFTGPLYGLPIFAVFYARTNLRLVLFSAAAAAIVAALPFFVFPNVSWSSYRFWVELSAHNGLRVAALKENIEWALFLLVPLLVRLASPTPLPPRARLIVPALLLGVCGVVVAASKPGAGAYHFVPFLPALAYALAVVQPDLSVRRTVWLTPFAITLVVIVLIQQQYFLRLLLDDAVADSYRDVAAFLDRHPNERIAMGYTSAERMTFARTLIVFKTNEYWLDVPAIQEHQLSGLPLPQATIDAITSCAVPTWLLPQTGEPFRIRNDYPSTGYSEIFPAEFIAAFQRAYTRQERTRYYDVWRCRVPGS